MSTVFVNIYYFRNITSVTTEFCHKLCFFVDIHYFYKIEF